MRHAGAMDPGWVVVALSAVLGVAGCAGIRSRRSVGAWTLLTAAAGAGVAAGGLMVQADPELAAWLVAPPIGAALSAVHARAVFAPGGPFRT
jgi:hypothetical protein